MREVYSTRIGMAFDETRREMGKRTDHRGLIPIVFGILGAPLILAENYLDSFRIPYSEEKRGYVYDQDAFTYFLI